MERRYEAMEQVAKASILTGISMMSIPGAQRSGMPILPGLCDTDGNLEATIRCTAEHGGKFVVAGGLTLADQQRDYFFGVLCDRFPDLLPLYERMYPHPSITYGGLRTGDPHVIGRRIRELRKQYGISDRMPRPVIPDGKRAHLRQAHRRGAGQRVLLATRGAGQCLWPTYLGLPQGRLGHRRPGTGCGADLPGDGTEGARGDRERGATVGGRH
jgi:hypothetical protein